MRLVLLRRSAVLHQVGLDEAIDLAVHHGRDIGGLVARAVVLDAAVIEDVAAYLRPPLDLLLPCLDLGLRPTATLQLLVVELRAQQAQRVLSIVRLAARLGILDDQLLLYARLGVGIAVAQAPLRHCSGRYPSSSGRG